VLAAVHTAQSYSGDATLTYPAWNPAATRRYRCGELMPTPRCQLLATTAATAWQRCNVGAAKPRVRLTAARTAAGAAATYGRPSGTAAPTTPRPLALSPHARDAPCGGRFRWWRQRWPAVRETVLNAATYATCQDSARVALRWHRPFLSLLYRHAGIPPYRCPAYHLRTAHARRAAAPRIHCTTLPPDAPRAFWNACGCLISSAPAVFCCHRRIICSPCPGSTFLRSTVPHAHTSPPYSLRCFCSSWLYEQFSNYSGLVERVTLGNPCGLFVIVATIAVFCNELFSSVSRVLTRALLRDDGRVPAGTPRNSPRHGRWAGRDDMGGPGSLLPPEPIFSLLPSPC